MIKWYGAFKIENGKVVDEYIFPEDKRDEILIKIRDGDYTPLPFSDEQIEIRGEIKDKNGLISTAIKIAKKEMRKKLGDDYILVEMLYTYDDIISILNLTNERLLEWEKITEIKGKKEDVESLLEDEKENLEKLRDTISTKIESLANKVCPNLSTLVGPIIAARLIASAGSLKRLATLPSSTIQVLGAEEAFFRHLKSGAKCPKHGIILRVPWVRNSPKKLRGKIARTLAAKIAMAAKIDYYGGEFVGDNLKEDMERRVNEVRSK